MIKRSAYQKLLRDEGTATYRPRLYKAGKIWLVAGVTTISLGLAGVTGVTTVKADTTSATDTTVVTNSATSTTGATATIASSTTTAESDSQSSDSATSEKAASSSTGTTAADSSSESSTAKTAANGSTTAATSTEDVTEKSGESSTESSSDSATQADKSATNGTAAATDNTANKQSQSETTTSAANGGTASDTSKTASSKNVVNLGAVDDETIAEEKATAAAEYAATGVPQTLTAVAATSEAATYADGITDADLVATLNEDPTTSVPAGDAGTITYTYIDALTGESITAMHDPLSSNTTAAFTGTETDAYTSDSIGSDIDIDKYDMNIQGYVLLSDTSSLAATEYTAGAYTSTLYYLPLKDVEVQLVDTDGNTIFSFTLPGKIMNAAQGDESANSYDASMAGITVPGYTLVSSPDNATGSYTEVQTSLSDTDPVVVQYVYQKTATSDDELYTSVPSNTYNYTVVGSGYVAAAGKPYDFNVSVANEAEQLAMAIANGYTEFAIQGDISGTMSANGENYYIYALGNSPVTVNYVIDNHDGTTTSLYTTTLTNANWDLNQFFPTGNYDTADTTATAIADGSLNLTGVTLEKIGGSTTGTYSPFGQTVTYYYTKDTPAMTTSIVSKTVNYVDSEGNTLSPSTLEMVGFTETTDPVTGDVTITPTERTLDGVTLPTIAGYHVVLSADATAAQSNQTVTNTSDNLTYTVVYEKDAVVTPPDNGGDSGSASDPTNTTGNNTGTDTTGTDTGADTGTDTTGTDTTGTDTAGNTADNSGDVTTSTQKVVGNNGSGSSSNGGNGTSTSAAGNTTNGNGQSGTTVGGDAIVQTTANSVGTTADSNSAADNNSRMGRYHKLPQTSETQEHVGALGLLALVTTMAGWLGFEKRKHE